MIRSIFSRLTLFAALTGGFVTALLYLVATYTVLENTNAALARTVDTDTAGLVDIYATGGQTELQLRLADRLAFVSARGDAAHYYLSDRKGKKIAGDMQEAPKLDPAKSQAGFIAATTGTVEFARATQLSPNLTLFVARGVGNRDALLREIAYAFLAAGLGVMLLLMAAGRQAAKRLRARVVSINDSFQADGDPKSVPSAPNVGHADELDQLSSHVRKVLDRQAALIVSHRNISDQTAHELRTPLMHLDMRLQGAIPQSKDQALTQSLVSAREEIKRITRMLESLLDIAANEAKGGDLHSLPETNISELAISIVDLFVDSAQEAGLALETAITPSVMMRCDAMQISRMLSNLLDNALKYVPSGGTIRLTIAAGPMISVVDNGPGITAAMRDIIFERFKRADGAQEDGHGLGLALVRAIAERHGLNARYDEAGPGAAFIIEPGRK